MISRDMLVVAVVGVIIGLAAGFAIVNSGTTGAVTELSKDAAGQLVISWLAANDVPASVLVVSDESGVYKVTVKANATSIASDLYVTKDGQMLFQPDVLAINQTIDQLLAKRAFFDCLAGKGLIFYGSTDTNATLVQLQVFGGTQFVDRVYIGCEGDKVQSCIDANITEVPTFVYENKSYTGAKPVDWFVNLTECTV